MAELKTGSVGFEYKNKRQIATTNNTEVYQEMVNSYFVEENQSPDDLQFVPNKNKSRNERSPG